jgi:carbon storage regulator
MLVLARRPGQRVLIGRDTEVTEVVVVEVRGDNVRLGFTAPAEVPVHREEVARAIEAQQTSTER